MYRWWKRTCLAEKLPFARDRLVECFFCTIGGLFEPQYGFCRTILTKVMSLLTVIDDIYNVYGTLEELELFTCAIERWDVNTIEQLPDYMQICYLAVVNFVNEIAYDILKDRGLVIIPYLRKAWTDICKAYLQEAKWYFNGYTPTLEEYMKNACITISAHVIMSHAFFSVTNPIEKEAVEYLQKYPVVIHWLATILRLADDLATSSDELKRGDVATSIQCYMKDTGASEDEARKHIKFLIRETWKKLNKDQHVDSPFSQTFIGIAVNFARMAKYLYQHGDGLGIQNLEVKHRIIAYSSLAENLNSMAIININILKPIYVCTFKNELPKMAFSLGANTSSLAVNVLQSSMISTKPCNQTVIRRSGNYRPPIWEFDYIQSLNSEYMGGRSVARASELKMQVKMMLDEAKEPIDQLELIDDLQRLGISYHFQDEINQILTIINRKYSENHEPEIKDLYATTLKFRLLRQHGFNVSQEIFDCFKNEKGDFNPSLCNDIKGLLQLYEASFLSTEGETTLEMAREFTMKYLDDHQSLDQYSALLVHRALELPLHWTIPRAEARWFIDVYGGRPDMNSILLEFAKLDFNIVQATYHQELKDVSRWWKRTCLAEKLPFVRDTIVECFFWNIGLLFEPQYGYFRTMSSKVFFLITILDDVYDVYGTSEELELFTDAVERWDVNAIERLPEYMQICYLALYNFVNEEAYDILKEKGLMIIPYLRKAWTDTCKAYLQEAKWYSIGYTPTLEEYMNNAWISVSAHTILVHAFFSVSNWIEESLQYLVKYHNVIRWSATILRLADDLATSSDELKRGDTPKSIQCYMNETAASEDDARKHVKFVISETWKKLNKDGGADCPFSQTFIEIAKNTGRMSQYMYQYGDGHGMSNSETKDRILALVFEPIPLA
ncbi:cineole-1 [Abeliophyllum distichum]|uniref:Cineole-1 n=1 Tax=Abeliophyllum distichum TaxID=126358 RepID=A0ABD1P9N3_9LAMI